MRQPTICPTAKRLLCDVIASPRSGAQPKACYCCMLAVRWPKLLLRVMEMEDLRRRQAATLARRLRRAAARRRGPIPRGKARAKAKAQPKAAAQAQPMADPVS